MCTTTDPATAAEALAMLESALDMQESALGFLAAEDAASLPGQAVADRLRALERGAASVLRRHLLGKPLAGRAVGFKTARSESSCAEPMCSMSRDPGREECTTCAAVAADAVCTVPTLSIGES
jgi:hypothetical protein